MQEARVRLPADGKQGNVGAELRAVCEDEGGAALPRRLLAEYDLQCDSECARFRRCMKDASLLEQVRHLGRQFR